MKYRSRTEIIDSILRATNFGASRTKIMYRSYLSYTQVKQYISFLLDNQLIRCEEESEKYWVTEKGLRYINAFDEIRELVSEPNRVAEVEKSIASNRPVLAELDYSKMP